MILQNGLNQKITLTSILGSLNSTSDILINPLQNAIRTNIASKNKPNLLYIDGVGDKIGVGTNNLSSQLLTIAGGMTMGSNIPGPGGDGVIAGSSEEVYFASGSGALELSLMRQTSILIAQSSTAASFILSNGFDGQLKTITFVGSTAGSGATASIAFLGINNLFHNITMSTYGCGCTLVYKSSSLLGNFSNGWCVVGNNGAIIS